MKRACILAACLAAALVGRAQMSLEFVGDTVTGISADGRVAVGANGDTGFRYSVGTGTYEALPFSATDVNGNGSIVVGVHSTTRRIHQWRGGVSAEVSALSFAAGTALIASNAYKIAGYRLFSSASVFVYDGSTVTSVPLTYGEPTGISGDGSTLVGFSDAGGFRYQDGALTDLGPQGLDWVGGVSGDGGTIIGRSPAIGAVYFNAAGVFEVPAPGSATSEWMELTAVSRDGRIVAGAFASSPDSEAFYWSESTGAVPLSQLFAIPEGWFLARVLDMSADGSVMVGQAWNLDGTEPRGFIMTGISVTPAPEPSTYGGFAALVLLAWVGYTRWRR